MLLTVIKTVVTTLTCIMLYILWRFGVTVEDRASRIGFGAMAFLYVALLALAWW